MLIVEKISDPSHLTGKLSPRGRGTHNLGHQNWVKAGDVRASFDIMHDGGNIYINYYVHENFVRAVNSQPNSSVWEDSCVEFFLSLKGDEKHYYNFEFNAIGTVLGAYGKDRYEREWLVPSMLEMIETSPSLGRTPFEQIDTPTSWTLQVRIPVDVLHKWNIDNISGKDGYANFYKCGDKLKNPHYISWNPVLTAKPDFHTPRYFGHISFI
jgi:hypothetical protein